MLLASYYPLIASYYPLIVRNDGGGGGGGGGWIPYFLDQTPRLLLISGLTKFT